MLQPRLFHLPHDFFNTHQILSVRIVFESIQVLREHVHPRGIRNVEVLSASQDQVADNHGNAGDFSGTHTVRGPAMTRRCRRHTNAEVLARRRSKRTVPVHVRDLLYDVEIESCLNMQAIVSDVFLKLVLLRFAFAERLKVVEIDGAGIYLERHSASLGGNGLIVVLSLDTNRSCPCTALRKVLQRPAPPACLAEGFVRSVDVI